MSKKESETCYMCVAPKVSREHVPPKCLFPEQKDLPAGMDYRKNLIKVPSCKVHNLNTSDHDEYLMAVLVWHFKNNGAAYNHAATKVLRALKRRDGALATTILQDAQSVSVRGQQTVKLKIDTERVIGELDKIARGLHFKHYNEKWTDELLVYPPSMQNENAQINIIHEELLRKNRQTFQNVPRHGENQEIFYYQFLEENGDKALRMVFYEGFEAVAIPKESLKKHV
ncbi:MAG: hypothetical protein JXR76_11345 [Deltaproteobacteria bacterium]|nr:hypothetical protein [Deltaproteobacteria bacterium]